MSMKLVLVGDGSVGKTSLLISYTSDAFPSDYVPTIFDNYLATVKYQNHFVKLWLWDTAGQDEYKRLRALSYPNTDVFLICFSLIDPKSFNHALNKWLPEIMENNPYALKFFVGTKSDLFREEQMAINVRRRPIVLPYPVVHNPECR
jgi:Ras-related C3 botulinum toxin substrate 1